MLNKKKKKIRIDRIILCILLPALLIAGLMQAIRIKRIYDGDIIANIPDPEKYPVNGVDVSRYQGTIDWNVLASQDVTFAFIKATEGSSHQDPCFAYNWREAQNSGVYVGAYHFFSFESSGETQAQNYIETVGSLNGALPPVIDIEFYGDYYNEPASKKDTRKILDDLLDKLESHYGVKPIIYTTARAYYSYILGGSYGDYPLWMRDTYMEPIVRWKFWQYSDQGVLEGYDGIQPDSTEAYIDLNVYNGSYEKFLSDFALPPREEQE